MPQLDIINVRGERIRVVVRWRRAKCYSQLNVNSLILITRRVMLRFLVYNSLTSILPLLLLEILLLLLLKVSRYAAPVAVTA